MTYSCLVTGGAGFIGSHLVDRLVRDGHRVRVLDNFSTGRMDNLQDSFGDVHLVEGDIRDQECVRRAVEGVDVVFHQAALPSVARSLADPRATHENNATGTLNVLLASRDVGVRRVICASSSSVYGDLAVDKKREDLPTAPKSPYAVSKLAAEQYCRAFRIGYGLETVALRYFNVFGPRQDPNSPYSAVVPRFVVAMLEGRRPVVYGDGRQSRDFTFVGNVVDANVLAANAPGVGGEVFNIACGDNHSLLELHSILRGITGAQGEPEFAPVRAGDVLHSRADVARAHDRLGFAPLVNFRQGLQLTVEWYQRLRLAVP